jgi:chemotaxis protein histidine kinase CheA
MSLLKAASRIATAFGVLVFLQPNAWASNWWDKSKSGWSNEDTQTVQADSSDNDERVKEITESLDSEPRGKKSRGMSESQADDLRQEIERRKKQKVRTTRTPEAVETDEVMANSDSEELPEVAEESPRPMKRAKRKVAQFEEDAPAPDEATDEAAPKKRINRAKRNPDAQEAEENNSVKTKNEDASEEEPPSRRLLKRKKRVARISEDEVSDEATADEARPKSRRAKKKRHAANGRRLASYSDDGGDEGSTRGTVRRRSYKKNVNYDLFRASVFGGYSPAKMTDSTGTNSSSGGSLINYGLNADLQLHYFGAEAEVYAGSGKGTVTSIADPTQSSAVALKQFGAMAAVKGQLPFYTNSVKWTPKLGVGYGTMSATQTQVSQSDTSTAKTSLSGVYVTAGFDVLPVSWLVLSADFARSLSASGSTNVEQTQVASNSSATLAGASMQRIRVGGDFYVSDHFTLGAHFVQRAFNYGSAIGATETQSQILGSLGLEF